MPAGHAADGAVTVEAPAKVNLTLRVLGTRPDGYHELESVVARLALGDTLVCRPGDGLSLAVEGLEAPAGEDNLVLRAARLLREHTGTGRGAAMHLVKRVPMGRGLGGGSSDAASALVGLNALWDLGLEAADLARLGADLGSDVPLFLGPPLAVMRGRGERIEPVRAVCRWQVALAWPPYGHPTPEVYAAYDALPAAADARPEATAVVAALGGPAAAAAPYLVNDLETAARTIRYDELDLGETFRRAGAEAVSMTGSGSAWFALAETPAEARRWADAAREAGADAVPTAIAEA